MRPWMTHLLGLPIVDISRGCSGALPISGPRRRLRGFDRPDFALFILIN